MHSASVVAMIKEICSNLSLSAENFVFQMPFLCRPCFRRVDRLIALKKELQDLVPCSLEKISNFFLQIEIIVINVIHFKSISVISSLHPFYILAHLHSNFRQESKILFKIEWLGQSFSKKPKKTA